MDGKHFGKDLSKTDDYFGHVQHIFQKRFQDPSPENHHLFGVNMGIAGDQSNNILWRLMRGELDKNFNPPFWWIVIGMEDLARYRCSEEIVIMGILRIVEEIKNSKPDAKIVINGLFPMFKLRNVNAPTDNDFIDAKRKEDKDMTDRRALKQSNNKNSKNNKNKNKNKFEEQSSPKNKANEFKKNLAERLEKRYQMIKEKNQVDEQNLEESLLATKRDNTISKDQKKAMMKDIRHSLDLMKQEHSRVEKSLNSYLKDLQKDQYNPIVKEKHTYHKDNLFHHNRGIPVWSAIHAINDQLHEFCKVTPHVTFYDPTPLFAQVNGPNTKLLTDFISSRGHPTQSGYKSWLSDVQRKVIEWKIEAEEEAKANAQNNNMDVADESENENDDGYFHEIVEQKKIADAKQDDNDDEDNGDDDIVTDDDLYYVQDDWM